MNKDNTGALLAIVALAGLLASIGLLFFVKIPEDNRDLLNIGLMAIVGVNGTAFGYFLGSSLGSQKKTDMLGKTPGPEPGDGGAPAAPMP